MCMFLTSQEVRVEGDGWGWQKEPHKEVGLESWVREKVGPLRLVIKKQQQQKKIFGSTVRWASQDPGKQSRDVTQR